MPYLDTFRLDGKTAIVTGASKNIGLEISRAFAEAGANVVMVARDPSLLKDRAAEIRSTTGAGVLDVPCDVSSLQSLSDLIDRVTSEIGFVDVLVNNAATIGTNTPNVLEIGHTDWADILNTNVVGPYTLISHFAREMIRGRGGSIINMLSTAGFQPQSQAMAYGASKAALWMMTRYLARECAPKVRVNAIVPGFIINPDGLTADESLIERYVPLTPMGRPGTPAEIAPTAVYLASDASSFTTGAVIVVNGGRAT